MRNRKQRQRGSAMIEFTLVGIPVIFVLISVFEISRGMWNYHTMAYAVREGTRYGIVHGFDCTSDPRNSCQVTLGQVAQRIEWASIGLDPSQLQLTFTSNGSSITCNLDDKTPTACVANATPWPLAPADTPGRNIVISGKMPFQSALAMFWPGAGPGINFPTMYFTASSSDIIQF
ncbi:MAG TPA: TadE/TadG family type IV pilus assembly protein [Terriglobales bacterium]|nr:TadE/TadG family type IV pilus assembly protein [Terriglobales bacterium]